MSEDLITVVIGALAIAISAASVVVSRRARRRSEDSLRRIRRAEQVSAMRHAGQCPNCGQSLAYIDWDARTYRSQPCGCCGEWEAALRD